MLSKNIARVVTTNNFVPCRVLRSSVPVRVKYNCSDLYRGSYRDGIVPCLSCRVLRCSVPVSTTTVPSRIEGRIVMT